MHLKDTFDHDVMATVVVTASQVFMRVKGDVVAQFDRRSLKEWLWDPVEEIRSRQTTLMVVPNGVAVGVDSTVPMSRLPDDVFRRLKVTVAATGRTFPVSRLPS